MINIQIDMTGALKAIDTAGKQARYAAAVALTRTAKEVEKQLVKDMRDTFDKPSPYTTRGTFSTGAKPQKLEAVVGLKDKGRVPPAVLLKEHFGGGVRGGKPFELALAGMGALPRGWRAIPGQGMPLDSYGNPKRTAIREMLGGLKSRMKIARSVGRGKNKVVQLQGYFVVPVGSDSHLHPGVWWQSGRGIKPVMIFVQAAAYRKVIDLPRSAAAVVHRDFNRLFSEAFEQAMRTAK